MTEAVHVYFKGHVQGVGFRFTCQNLARQDSISGWVRNLPDGRVELYAQSSSQKLIRYLAKIKHHFQGYIEAAQEEWKKPDKEFEDFEIRFLQ